MTLRTLAGALFAALLASAGRAGAVEPAALPPKLQAAVTQKILGFDRSLGERAKRVLVVYGDPAAQRDANTLVAALEAQKLAAKVVAVGDLQAEPAPLAVFLVSAVGLDRVQKYCSTMKVLSMTQDAALVRSGQISIGIAAGRERPVEIWINLARARAEWQDLAAELLQVSRVVN